MNQFWWRYKRECQRSTPDPWVQFIVTQKLLPHLGAGTLRQGDPRAEKNTLESDFMTLPKINSRSPR